MVGAGESVNTPATFSLLADLFPRERLPRAIAVMQLGLVAGNGIVTGPTVVASITQFVLQSEAMLRYALVATSAIVGPLSLLIIWLGVRPYARAVSELRAA
jgi:MFS family permease